MISFSDVQNYIHNNRGVTELYRCSWRAFLSLQTPDKSWLWQHCSLASELFLEEEVAGIGLLQGRSNVVLCVWFDKRTVDKLGMCFAFQFPGDDPWQTTSLWQLFVAVLLGCFSHFKPYTYCLVWRSWDLARYLSVFHRSNDRLWAWYIKRCFLSPLKFLVHSSCFRPCFVLFVSLYSHFSSMWFFKEKILWWGNIQKSPQLGPLRNSSARKQTWSGVFFFQWLVIFYYLVCQPVSAAKVY